MSEDAERALRAWSFPGDAELRSNRDGLINRTYVVSVAQTPTAVLQALNTRIFAPRVHEDIEAVTLRLHEAGVATPMLQHTRRGALWHEAPDGSVWRCLSYEGDRTDHKVRSAGDAASAAKLVARFHAAVRDLPWEFRSVRRGAHDTAAHMAALGRALEEHREHRLYDTVSALAADILGRYGECKQRRNLAHRVIHGDLKISNVRFAGSKAHCLIDLDTMARDMLDVELGDAMRSWCNPAAEDAEETAFDLGVFEAAMYGYAEGTQRGPGLTRDEWESIVPGIERIALELASRFARDALEESYFGWNPRFGSLGDHNVLRARGQLALARSVRAQRKEMDAVITLARCHAG